MDEVWLPKERPGSMEGAGGECCNEDAVMSAIEDTKGFSDADISPSADMKALGDASGFCDSEVSTDADMKGFSDAGICGSSSSLWLGGKRMMWESPRSIVPDPF